MVLTDDDDLAERVRLLAQPRVRAAALLPRATRPQLPHDRLPGGHGTRAAAKIDHILAEKRRVAATYTRLLADVPGISTPVEQPWARHVYWMYGVVVEDDSGSPATSSPRRCSSGEIETRTFFCPMNLQPFLRDQPGFRDVRLPGRGGPVARASTSPRPSLTDEEIADIATQSSSSQRSARELVHGPARQGLRRDLRGEAVRRRGAIRPRAVAGARAATPRRRVRDRPARARLRRARLRRHRVDINEELLARRARRRRRPRPLVQGDMCDLDVAGAPFDLVDVPVRLDRLSADQRGRGSPRCRACAPAWRRRACSSLSSGMRPRMLQSFDPVRVRRWEQPHAHSCASPTPG